MLQCTLIFYSSCSLNLSISIAPSLSTFHYFRTNEILNFLSIYHSYWVNHKLSNPFHIQVSTYSIILTLPFFLSVFICLPLSSSSCSSCSFPLHCQGKQGPPDEPPTISRGGDELIAGRPRPPLYSPGADGVQWGVTSLRGSVDTAHAPLRVLNPSVLNVVLNAPPGGTWLGDPVGKGEKIVPIENVNNETQEVNVLQRLTVLFL